jgi:hypothetical protein
LIRHAASIPASADTPSVPEPPPNISILAKEVFEINLIVDGKAAVSFFLEVVHSSSSQ